MTAVRTHIAVLCCLAAVSSTLNSGCTVGSKSFSMDSTSRTPFFGLELRERKAKSNGPTFNSISWSYGDASRLDSALSVVPATSSLAIKKNTSQMVAANDRAATVSQSRESEVAYEAAVPPVTRSILFPSMGKKPAASTCPASEQSIDFQ